MTNPADPLAEYGGLGFLSPQQGSTVPSVSAPPAGPSSLGPPAAPPPAGLPFPAVPRANLLNLGAQPAPLEQLIQQNLQAMQNYSGAGYWDKFLNRGNVGTRNYEAMQQLPELGKLAGIRSQDRQLQEKFLTNIHTNLDKYLAQTPEQQKASLPLYQQLIGAHAQLAGLQAKPEDIAHVLSTPDIAAQYRDVLGDNLIDNQAALTRLGSVPAGEQRRNELGMIQGEAAKQATTLIQQYLPQAVTQFGGSSAKPLAMDAFVTQLQADPQLGEALKGSRTLRTMLQGWLNDPKNADVQAGLGLIPGKVNLEGMLEKAKQQAQGPQLTGGVKDILAQMKGPTGQPLLPSQATPEQIGVAQQRVFSNELEISSKKGYAAVVEAAKANRTIPLIQMPNGAHTYFVNKVTEMPVDRILTNFDTLEKGGGEAKFAAMDEKRNEAFMAAKEADGVLGLYLDISRALTTTPGANFAQALTMYAKTKGGVENPGVQFDALRGTILRMARAMQGSSQSLSNLDANSVAGMLPTPLDTAQSAIQRLEVAAKIVKNMKDVQLGKMEPTQLLEKIAVAKQDIARAQGADVFKHEQTGQVIALPRGQSHPGKGWVKQ